MLAQRIDQLAALAKKNAAEQGWDLDSAHRNHDEELHETLESSSPETVAKNLADVLWLFAASSGLDAGYILMHTYPLLASMVPPSQDSAFNLEAAVLARVEELITRLETTGSLVRAA